MQEPSILVHTALFWLLNAGNVSIKNDSVEMPIATMTTIANIRACSGPHGTFFKHEYTLQCVVLLVQGRDGLQRSAETNT